MKRKKIRIKIIPVTVLGIVIISLILLIGSCTKKEEEIITPKPTTFIKEFTNSSGIIVDEEIKKKIVEFVDLYYLSMKELNEYNMMYLFSEPTSKEAYLTQTAMSYLISYRLSQRNDLKLTDCYYNLDIKKVDEDTEKIVLTVNEDSFVNFAFMKDIRSESLNIKNKFTFSNDNELIAYEKFADFYNVITDNYEFKEENTDQIIKTELETFKEQAISDVKKAVVTEKSYYEAYLTNKLVAPKKCDHTYDREMASNYALEWSLKRNSEYAAYDIYGGNCQNYASQVLKSGGIPNDLTGIYKWKYYGSGVDETSLEKGRTPSWTGVSQFYDYARNNNGYGLCASVNINYFAAEAGDVMQVGSMNKWVHTIVVSGIVEEDGKIVDLLTTSNTTDRKNYPLSAYNYAGKRLIKIYGWNEE